MATAQVANSVVWGFFIWWLYQQPPISGYSLKGAVSWVVTAIGLDPTSGWGLLLGGATPVSVFAGVISWVFWMIAAWPFYRASGKQGGMQ